MAAVKRRKASFDLSKHFLIRQSATAVADNLTRFKIIQLNKRVFSIYLLSKQGIKVRMSRVFPDSRDN